MPRAKSPSSGSTQSYALSVGSREVRLAARSWVDALALRPLLWSLPLVVLGCVLGRAWADAARAESPGSVALFAPALAAVALWVGLRKYLQAVQAPRWGAMGAAGLCVLGLATTHATRRWTPERADISRLLAARESRLRPLEPVRGRVVARVAEIKRGERRDFAVLELAPAPATSVALRGARGRFWAEMPRSPQVLAGTREVQAREVRAREVRAGDWVRARVELRELRAPGSAAEADGRAFALVRGCWCEGEVLSIEAVAPPRAGWAAGNFNGVLDAARASIARRFDSGFGRLGVPFARQSAQVATAMAFGEGGLREPLPGEVRQAFKRAGVSHVLVASGAQVAIVCVLLWSVARLLCAPVRSLAWRNFLMALATVPALVFYALLVGGAASIWRATLIGLGALWVQAQGRRLDALSLWCGALSLLLLCDPASLYDLSLQLSFGAAWGLIAFSAPLQRSFLAPLRRFEPEPSADSEAEDHAPSTWRVHLRHAISSAPWVAARGLSGVAAVSVAAHAGTLPVLLHAFGTVSVASLGANLPIVPLSGLLVVSGSASLAVPIRPLDAFNYALADGALRVVGAIAGWRSSWIEAPPLSLSWTLLLGALAIALAGAVAWPRLLFACVPRPEDQGDDNSDEPRAPSAWESSLLWRASVRCVSEAAASKWNSKWEAPASR